MKHSACVLGVSALFHDSAAALVDEKSIIAAAQEERFTRLKGDWRFPDKSIEFCLSQMPEGRIPDALAYYENPLTKLDRFFTCAARNAPRGALSWPQLLKTAHEINTQLPARLAKIQPNPSKIYFTLHHRAHAASAFYPSPFERAAILIVDGVGEWATTSIWRGDEEGLANLAEIRFPNSLGLFYSAFTQYCGFKVNSGEYKLMGLAPFGNPAIRQIILSQLIDIKEDGSFNLNLKYFGFHTSQSTINPLFEELMGQPARLPDESITKHYMDVAASVQSIVNEIMVALASSAIRKTGLSKLCLAGGVALNCVANTAILHGVQGLDEMWIQPASGDAGGALGAALDVSAMLSGNRKRPKNAEDDAMRGTRLGPQFNAQHIETSLKMHQLNYEVFDSDFDLRQAITELLSAKKIIGYFNGPMEFGPRALGGRSILADPRFPGVLKRVNLKIKFREGWRPFAPIILEDYADEVFEHPAISRYMLHTTRIKPQYQTGDSVQDLRKDGVYDVGQLQDCDKTAFNAISHVDYTSRLQTLRKEDNATLHKLLEHYYNKTGCPMLLNTSFNIRGEPIVCAPRDAIQCFLRTDMDVLAIGPFLVRKSAQVPAVLAKFRKRKPNAS